MLRSDDARPDVNSTPGESRDAKPAWFIRTPGFSRDATNGASPATHVADAANLFSASEAYVHEGPVTGQLVVCRADVEFEEFKSFSPRPGRHQRADLILTGWMNDGGGNERSTWVETFGWKESNHSYIVFPLTWLQEGQRLTLRMADLDRIADRDFIEQVSIEYAGVLPLRHAGERSRVECRVLADRPVHELALDACWGIDRALVDLERDPPSPQTPIERGDLLQERFYELARLVGWADPRMRKRVAQLEALWPGFPGLPNPTPDEGHRPAEDAP